MTIRNAGRQAVELKEPPAYFNGLQETVAGVLL
ncbi:uncharacterized protein METZ01_LOCUS498734, partial [marine metagenome]